MRALNYPFLALTLLTLGRGWYLQRAHGGATVWQRRARRTLVLSTALAGILWGLRFGGVLGMRPF